MNVFVSRMLELVCAKEELEIVIRAAPPPFPDFRGGTSSPPQAAKCAVPRSKLCFTTGVRTNSRIQHITKKHPQGKCFLV